MGYHDWNNNYDRRRRYRHEINSKKKEKRPYLPSNPVERERFKKKIALGEEVSMSGFFPSRYSESELLLPETLAQKIYINFHKQASKNPGIPGVSQVGEVMFEGNGIRNQEYKIDVVNGSSFMYYLNDLNKIDGVLDALGNAFSENGFSKVMHQQQEKEWLTLASNGSEYYGAWTQVFFTNEKIRNLTEIVTLIRKAN